MKLFAGIGRWFRGKTNAILSWFEDPKKILTQTIEDMKTELSDEKNKLLEVEVEYRKMEKDTQRCRAEVSRAIDDIQRAVANGNDTLARDAITRKKDREISMDRSEGLLQKQAQLLTKYRRTVDQMAAEIMRAKEKKAHMESQIRYNEAAQKIADADSALGSPTGNSAFATFARITEVVDDATVRAEVASEMVSKESGAGMKLLEATTSGEVEDELKAWKTKLLPQSTEKS